MDDLRTTLKDRPDLRKYLFIRGFLITDDSSIDGKSFPFFGEWKCTKLGDFCVWTHRNTGFYWVHQDERIFSCSGMRTIRLLWKFQKAISSKELLNTWETLISMM